MDKSEFDITQKKKDGVQIVKPEPFEADLLPKTKTPAEQFERQYASLLLSLRTVRQPLSTAPTFVPKNFLEQFQLYENGATYRLYIYVNGTWRYTALT